MQANPTGATSLAIHPTWRIVVAMLVVQIPGAGIGLWMNRVAGDWLMDCWYGAAFALPFGYVLGVLWQTRVSVHTLAQFRWHVLGYGLFSAAMPAFGALTIGVWTHAAAA
jgi:hypothetical protein